MAEKAIASSTDIDSVLQEQRSFEPSPEFRQSAHIKSVEEYDRIYRESVENPDGFCALKCIESLR